MPIERTVVIDCHIEDVFEHLARDAGPGAAAIPPHRIAVPGEDGAEVVYELEPVWTATRVTRRDAVEVGPLRAIGRRRGMTRRLRALKHELERRA